MSKTFGILAFPAGHSLSPAIHSRAFREVGFDEEYVRFEIPPAELADFFARVRREKIAGLSISIPHKISSLEFLDEVDEAVTKIGATNTVFWREEKLVGTNTDWLGVVGALEAATEIANKKAVVLGGGGAARAAIFGLQKMGAEVSVLARDVSKLTTIKKDFGVAIGSLAGAENFRGEIFVNATPLGMTGEFENLSPLPADFFRGDEIVFDTVYTPRETQLLKNAKQAGCLTVEGLEMFVRQAAAQFEIWTGESAPLSAMRAEVEKNLS